MSAAVSVRVPGSGAVVRPHPRSPGTARMCLGICAVQMPTATIALNAIVVVVPRRGDLLREVMRETRITQSALSRLSGVRQPSISQFLSGTVELSDEQLDRLLSCMGYRLEVTRRPVIPQLTRSERRSWRLHCRLSIRLTPDTLEEWRPVIERNLQRVRGGVTGQPHTRNLDRWESLIRDGDVLGLHRVLTGLDPDSIEMREVSPMGGLLPQDERQAALREAADETRPA